MRDLVGHASITTTERYDNQKLESLQAAVLRLESGKAFEARRRTTALKTASMMRTNFLVFFKKRRTSRGSTMERANRPNQT